MNISATGVQYVFGEKEPILKRTLWTLLLLGGVGFLCYHVYDRIITYTSWATVTSIRYENWKELPFPQVTFCPNQYFFQRVLSEQWTNNEQELINNVSTNWTQILIDWAPKKETLFEKLIFQDEPIPSMEGIQKIFVEDRVCWTLNANGSLISESGFISGIDVILNVTEDDIEYGDINGYNILLSKPNHLPSVYSDTKLFPLHQQVEIKLNYEVFKRLKTYDLNGPSCLNESYSMKIFPTYNEHHCAVEKFIQVALSECNCSLFLGPDSVYDNWYRNYFSKVPRSCSPVAYKCLFGLWKYQLPKIKHKCLPTCETFSYSVELYHAPSKNGKLKVRLYFSSNKVKVTTESLAYHWLTLMADLGGATGLFLGASLFTLVEIAQWLIEWCLLRCSSTRVDNNLKTSLSPIQIQPISANT